MDPHWAELVAPALSVFGQCGFSDEIFYFTQWLEFIPKRLTSNLLFSVFLNSAVSLDPDDTVRLPAGTCHSLEGGGCFSPAQPAVSPTNPTSQHSLNSQCPSVTCA